MDPFFTFLDGALRYDCPTCGQACCRGKGMALDARELVPLLVREPRLAPLVTSAPSGLAGWADVTDGCWFLRDDGWCRIEKEHGRDAKPTTCKLFPFNRVFRAGAVRVIDFNSVICPLADAQAAGQPGVTHRELLEDLEKLSDGPLTASQAPVPAGAEGRWEPLERTILEASCDHLGRTPAAFAGWQEAATAAWLRAPAGGGFPTRLDALDPSRERMQRLERAWELFYGLDAETSATAELARGRSMALLTPSLRFNTLFRRNGPAWAAAVVRLPRLTLATSFLARVGQGLAPRTSLRALTELHQNTGSVRELLARWDEPAVVASPLGAVDAPEPLASAVRAAAERLSPFRGAPRTLGDVLAETWSPMPPPLRAVSLAVFARSGADLRFDEARPGAAA